MPTPDIEDRPQRDTKRHRYYRWQTCCAYCRRLHAPVRSGRKGRRSK